MALDDECSAPAALQERRAPASVALRSRLLSLFCKSVAAANCFPHSLTVGAPAPGTGTCDHTCDHAHRGKTHPAPVPCEHCWGEAACLLSLPLQTSAFTSPLPRVLGTLDPLYRLFPGMSPADCDGVSVWVSHHPAPASGGLSSRPRTCLVPPVGWLLAVHARPGPLACLL